MYFAISTVLLKLKGNSQGHRESRRHISRLSLLTTNTQELSSGWDGRPFGHNRHGPKSGSCYALFGGAGFPSNTMSPGPRPTSIPNGILLHPAVWPQQTWAENLETVPFFRDGKLGPHLTQCGQDEGLRPCQVALWSIYTVWPWHTNVTDRQTGEVRTDMTTVR